MDFYEELDIERSLSTYEIKRELIRLTRVWIEQTATQNLEKLNLVYRKLNIISKAEDIFKTDESRRIYDEYLIVNKDKKSEDKKSSVMGENFNFDRKIDYNTYIQKALELHRENQGREGLSLALAITKVAPNIAEAWNVLGIIYRETGHVKESINSYKKALDLSPKDIIYTNNLGYLYLDTGRIEDAKVMLNKSLNIDPNDLRTLLFKSEILQAENLYDEAVILVESLLKNDPSSVKIKERLSEIHYYKGLSYCYYVEEDDKLVIVEGDNIPIVIEEMQKAKKYNYKRIYDEIIDLAKVSKEKSFDDRNKKLFIFPFVAIIGFPNIVGVIIALVSSYIIYKSSFKTIWEKNRELYLDEDITIQKAKKETQNLILNTNNTLKEAKSLINDRIDSMKSKDE